MTKQGETSTGAGRRPKQAPIGEKRRTFTFRLRDEVRQRVEASAALAGRSLSEELEWRVQRSLDEEDRLIERFGTYESLNVCSTIASAWHSISILSKKKWTEDAETLDLCKRAAVNIISWLKAYKAPEQSSEQKSEPQSRRTISALERLGLDLQVKTPEFQREIKQDRLAFEAAKWAISLSRGLTEEQSDAQIRKLIMAVRVYEDPNFIDTGELTDTLVSRWEEREGSTPQPMRDTHEELPD